ncbi:MAG: hypothetical protein K9N47_19970 [Prosthecobacter sp.]|uniref:hypothetical protein n=1 Tax=Prosthecobacter sp. TaxID=1965333 RepID=UPI0025D86922|nr:hypothetical protein [Prosthecobacter sp.]MCF7788408.1 hypothetical protein [Prosthecobacter sp.]
MKFPPITATDIQAEMAAQNAVDKLAYGKLNPQANEVRRLAIEAFYSKHALQQKEQQQKSS